MNVKQLKITIAILIVFIVVSVVVFRREKIPCDGCGGCKYENFTDKVKVKKVVLVGDSIDVIHLKSIIDDKATYQIDSYEYAVAIEKDFDEKEIKDSLKKYTISGERIINGACTPYLIQRMKIERK